MWRADIFSCPEVVFEFNSTHRQNIINVFKISFFYNLLKKITYWHQRKVILVMMILLHWQLLWKKGNFLKHASKMLASVIRLHVFFYEILKLFFSQEEKFLILSSKHILIERRFCQNIINNYQRYFKKSQADQYIIVTTQLYFLLIISECYTIKQESFMEV